MTSHLALQHLIDRVRAARADGVVLNISGGNTKAFYGEAPVGEVLDVTPLAGITSYEPSELVVTVRAGTLLAELEAVLAEKGQCLPFEPPRFAGVAAGGDIGGGTLGGTAGGTASGMTGGTVGGMVSTGLAGPSRAAVGSVRDHVLGACLLNGRAEVLAFGGTVMKNVAGYDVSRLLVGAMGTLGVILEVSIKVLPVAPASATLRFEMDEATALKQLNHWGGLPLPINASAWWNGTLVLRLCGAAAAVQSAVAKLGGELVEPELAAGFWAGLRDQSDEFFVGAAQALATGARLWRLAVPQTAPALQLSGEQLVEWGGAQRWVVTSAAPAVLREAAARVGGHATVFRAVDRAAAPAVSAFTPLSAPLARIHREMKKSFDPDGIFNRGRLYPDL